LSAPRFRQRAARFARRAHARCQGLRVPGNQPRRSSLFFVRPEGARVSPFRPPSAPRAERKRRMKSFAHQGLQVPGDHRPPSGRSRKNTLFAHVSSRVETADLLAHTSERALI
jgi:hypothetical protein